MGQIANQMALELFFKIKEHIKEKKEEKKQEDAMKKEKQKKQSNSIFPFEGGYMVREIYDTESLLKAKYMRDIGIATITKKENK